MRVTAKADYAVRALAELAVASADGVVTAEVIAQRQDIPLRFLIKILNDLRLSRLVESRRGNVGGYRLAQPPGDISIAEVIRAVEGPLADVRGTPPEDLDYPASVRPLREVWLATRAAVRSVLERVTIADLARGELPEEITRDLADPGALHRR